MTDAQLAALLTAIVGSIGTLGAVIRWAVTRVTKAIDDSTASRNKQAEAEVELAKSLTTMALRLEDAIGDISIVKRWVEEHTPVDGVEQPPSLRAPPSRNTPTRGLPIIERPRRPKTNVEDPDR